MKRKREFGSFYWRKDRGTLHLNYSIAGVRQRPKFAEVRTGTEAERKHLERRARLRLNEIEVEIDTGVFFESVDCPDGVFLREQFPLFRQMADFYWDKQELKKDYIQRDIESRASERSKLERVIGFFGDMRADEVSKSDIKEFRKWCRQQVGRNKKPWGNRYINTLVSKIGQVYRCCIGQEVWSFDSALPEERRRYGNIDLCANLSNPGHGLPRLKEELKEGIIPSEDQFKKFLQLLPSPLMCAAVIAAHTGLRRRNVFGLRVKDLDFEREIINIPNHKGKPPIICVMHKDLLTILPVVCSDRSPDDLVICKPDGSSYRDFRASWNKAAAGAEIQGFTFRGCRNMYGSWMAGLGAEMGLVQRVLGHTTVQTTARFYNRAQRAHEKILHLQPNLLGDSSGDKPVTETSAKVCKGVQGGAR